MAGDPERKREGGWQNRRQLATIISGGRVRGRNPAVSQLGLVFALQARQLIHTVEWD